MAAELARHYRALGLPKRASRAEVRAAYLELAKKWHPDINRRRNALQRFQQINDAYLALVDRDPGESVPARAPNGHEAAPKRVRIPVPLTCSRCGEATAQPRQASYASIFSLLLLSWRKESSGIFCPSCARRESLRSSLISGLFGWWSLPGLVLTPLAVLRNARGGKSDDAANLNFLCHNLQAYEAAGNEEAARRIAYILARTPSSVAVKINMSVAALIASDAAPPAPRPDEWKPRMDQRLLHIAAAAAVPVAVALTVARLIV
ncbi:J domain-containing protein [Sphingosinicella rhizophila]|uniref:J domain-containing protein n=1 Tax=Sphingosinicella rhizophila TaxID=3050082 RepID=A0ABU3Q665_9SPHN|nr:J domain-containing protein [Sphingosinicella sp. GR2756]MDT9598890.1 J domain-containing protein [Sphingosinicella sp. GR2756]